MITFNRNVIGELLFDTDDEATQSMREIALAVFKPLEDEAVLVDASDSSAREKCLNWEAQRVKITSVRSFKMILEFTSMGESFRSASRFL